MHIGKFLVNMHEKNVGLEKFLETDQHPQTWPIFKYEYFSWSKSQNLFLLTADSLDARFSAPWEQEFLENGHF